jgi:hypothetical protein
VPLRRTPRRCCSGRCSLRARSRCARAQPAEGQGGQAARVGGDHRNAHRSSAGHPDRRRVCARLRVERVLRRWSPKEHAGNPAEIIVKLRSQRSGAQWQDASARFASHCRRAACSLPQSQPELAGSWSKFCSAASSIFTRKQIIGCACSPKEHGPGPMYPHPPPRRIGANFRGRLRQFHGSTTALRILGREAFVGQHARGDRPPAHRRDSSRPSPPAPALRAIPPPARAGLKLAALAKSLHSLSVFRQGFPILGVQIGS